MAEQVDVLKSLKASLGASECAVVNSASRLNDVYGFSLVTNTCAIKPSLVQERGGPIFKQCVTTNGYGVGKLITIVQLRSMGYVPVHGSAFVVAKDDTHRRLILQTAGHNIPTDYTVVSVKFSLEWAELLPEETEQFFFDCEVIGRGDKNSTIEEVDPVSNYPVDKREDCAFLACVVPQDRYDRIGAPFVPMVPADGPMHVIGWPADSEVSDVLPQMKLVDPDTLSNDERLQALAKSKDSDIKYFFKNFNVLICAPGHLTHAQKYVSPTTGIDARG